MTQSMPGPDRAGMNPRNATLRAVIFALGAGEIVAFVIFEWVALHQTGAIGQRVGEALALIALAPFCLLVLPALVLAARNRALPVAFALALLVLPIALYAMHVLT